MESTRRTGVGMPLAGSGSIGRILGPILVLPGLASLVPGRDQEADAPDRIPAMTDRGQRIVRPILTGLGSRPALVHLVMVARLTPNSSATSPGSNMGPGVTEPSFAQDSETLIMTGPFAFETKKAAADPDRQCPRWSERRSGSAAAS